MNRRLLLSMLVIFGSFLMLTSANGQKAEAIEDFETGDFSLYNWQLSGNANWTITDVNPYEGNYSAKSGFITHSQNSSIELVYEVYVQDTLSFWYKVSSESGYDYLRFYLNGVEQDEWSGIIPWSKAEFVIPAGTHTFKWEYSKDFSVSSGDDAAWLDLITFPPSEIEAAFTADTTVICEGDIAYFFDQSIGPVTEWNWTFEGGTPATSTLQNPVTGYGTPGVFDVLLEVSDGVETASLYMPEYITVSTTPSQASTPTGISYLCASWGNSTYNVAPMSGVSTYTWELTPTEAGNISGSGTNITVVWAPDFLGDAELKVGGNNYCGVGQFSDPLIITRYLPDVSLILPAFVAIEEPAFELTGGIPTGGTYSGPGVSNGMFDPAAAGLGTHVITYTYTDPNLCTGTATDSITVTQFIGYGDHNTTNALSVYPNPSTGIFTLHTGNLIQSESNIKIYNALNSLVYEEKWQITGKGINKDLNLKHLAKGVYFLRVTGDSFDLIRKIVIRD